MTDETNYLPGEFIFEPGTIDDYHALARFHYLEKKPATVACIWRARFVHRDKRNPDQIAAVGVLSYPAACSRERNLVFGLSDKPYREKLLFANANLRTISRVIVHPTFRSAGLAAGIVKRLCEHCPTRFVEAMAKMGRVHPLFERAGMMRFTPAEPDRPVYFCLDRGAEPSPGTPGEGRGRVLQRDAVDPVLPDASDTRRRDTSNPLAPVVPAEPSPPPSPGVPGEGESLLNPCRTPDELHAWIKHFVGVNVPRRSVCPHHQAPFEYLLKSYFEPARDLVVWAPRGGGKTRLAAVATLLDLLHKPGIAITILGGSLLQSLRMWDHLIPDLDRIAEELLDGKKRSRCVRLTNDSHAEVVAQSQRAVRGLRVQKLRCDELELFDSKVLDAAKLTTRSLTLADGSSVAGTMEALSTLHTPWGLMHDWVEQSEAAARPVIKWCVLDVLEKCPPDRECASCPLWDDCRGLAKTADGFLPIDDAIALKRRASVESWEAEMLCKRPSVKGCVFPTFDPDQHVCENISTSLREGVSDSGSPSLSPQSSNLSPPLCLAIDFGFSNPFACLWIADDGSTVHVIDEYVQSGRTMDEHLRVIESRPWGKVRAIACDPAGNSRNDQTAESNVTLLRRRGYVVRSKPSGIVDGLELIRRDLRSGSGEVSLFVHPQCRNLIKALRSYHYPTGYSSELPFKDGENDHLIDALRYFYVNRAARMAAMGRAY